MQNSVATVSFWLTIATMGLSSVYAEDSNLRKMQIHFQTQSPIDESCIKYEGELTETEPLDRKRQCHSDKLHLDKNNPHGKKRFGYGRGYGKRK